MFLILLSSVPIKLITYLAYLFAWSPKTRFAGIREITFGLLYGCVYLHVSQKHFSDLSQFNSPRKSKSAVCCCDGSCFSCLWNELQFPKRIVFTFQGTLPVTFLSVKKYFHDWFLCNYHRCYSITVFLFSCLFRKLKVFFCYCFAVKTFFSQLKLGKKFKVRPVNLVPSRRLSLLKKQRNVGSWTVWFPNGNFESLMPKDVSVVFPISSSQQLINDSLCINTQYRIISHSDLDISTVWCCMVWIDVYNIFGLVTFPSACKYVVKCLLNLCCFLSVFFPDHEMGSVFKLYLSGLFLCLWL